MREWLTIELVLSTLLVTSFTCVGLLALWAAKSERHWFVRTAIVFIVLSPLLAVPALEPFVVFAIQSAVVAFGVMLYRRRVIKHSSTKEIETDAEVKAAPCVRFSLTTVMLGMVLVAIVAAIAVRFPRLNVPGWTTIFLNGAAAEVSTLVGAWMLAASRKILV
jgi:hypothetical protein